MKRSLLNILQILAFVSPVWAQNTISFTEHSVDENFAGVSVVCSIDIDKDGLKDLVCGSETTSPTSPSIGIWWLRNNGDGTWTRHEIGGDFTNVMSIEIFDVDDDGNPDVLASGWSAHQIAYWQNSGGSIPVWTKVTVNSNFYNAHDAHPFDVNKDGLIDIVGVSAYLGQVIIWYQQPDGSFTEQIIDNSFTGGRALAIADYNNDGNIDVSAVSATKKHLVVYFANSENPAVWTKQIVNATLDGAHEVINFDADNDGDIDMLTSAYNSNQIDVWKNNGANPVVWSREPVGFHVGVNRALPADFNGDGDVDVVATGKYPTSKLSLWYNQGGSPNTYSETIINDQLSAFWALCVDDFDNDGDLDFIAGASASGVIRWWENNLISTGLYSPDKTNQNIDVYPNPNTGFFKASISNDFVGEVIVQIHSDSGKVLFSTVLTKAQRKVSIEFNNSGLAPGTYFINTLCGNLKSTDKFIVL